MPAAQPAPNSPADASDAQSKSIDAQSPSTNAPPNVAAFLRSHCLDCHDGPSGEAGLDVHAFETDAGLDLSNAAQLHRWIRIVDRVRSGEMPPPDSTELSEKDRSAFTQQVSKWIDGYLSRQHRSEGRVPVRRLTNDQLEATLCDLFAIDIPLSRMIPEETRTDGFRNIAKAQSISHYHLNDHLAVVDAALDAAFQRVTRPDPDWNLDMPPQRIANKPRGRRNRDPELRKGLAVVWNGRVSFYGRISNSEIRQSGWHRITLTASAVRPPSRGGVWCSVRSGQCVSNAPLMNWIGSFQATSEPTEHEYVAWIDQDHMLEIRPADATLKLAKFRGGQIGFGEGESQDAPGLALHHLKIERIYPGGSVDAVRERLFGELDVRFNREKRRWEWVGDAPLEDLTVELNRFARRAFRAPVSPQIMKPYLSAVENALRSGEDPLHVLRDAYRALLCSPRFIYFQESSGPLSDHAIASRLSYFLTGSMPDDVLSDLADQGKLRDATILRQQARRLLQGENLKRFVADFSDQWLDLADIAFTEPDRRLHKDFDLVVQDAMVEETRRFLTTLIEEDLPARQLVNADFTWLNERLARYYGIDTEIGESDWRRVSLSGHARRGGLMAHGSVLKVTANGSNTSPVLRGVWVCDRLLGIDIPEPPDNVPAIEPDIRGAKTIRETLEKHRSIEQCASCHAKIDPPGFALESFDAAGQWREHYTVSAGRSLRRGPKVDPSYQLADGTKFQSFTEFRQLAAENERRIAENFAAKLLVYATGGEITFVDRKALDAIASDTEQTQYGLRSLIESVVTSHPFLHK